MITWGTVRSSNFPKVAQLVSNLPRLLPQRRGQPAFPAINSHWMAAPLGFSVNNTENPILTFKTLKGSRWKVLLLEGFCVWMVLPAFDFSSNLCYVYVCNCGIYHMRLYKTNSELTLSFEAKCTNANPCLCCKAGWCPHMCHRFPQAWARHARDTEFPS